MDSTNKKIFDPDMVKDLKNISDYVDKELSEKAKYYDETSEYPSEIVDYFFKKNIFSKLTSNDAKDLAFFLEVIRIISKKFASLASILLTQGFYGVIPFYHFASDQQRSKYLPDLIQGNKMGALALSEENKKEGSFSSLGTFARETKKGWEITGSKNYVSNATVADVFLIVAKTYQLNGSEGIGIFIVEKSMAGLKIMHPMDKMGVKSLPVSSITLDKVVVDKESLLGNDFRGNRKIDFIMNLMKLSVSMQALGISQGAFDKGLGYMRLERKFGNRLIDNLGTRQEMAKLKTNISSAESFLKKIILTNPQNKVEVSMVKLLTAEMSISTTEKIIQLTGGYGYMKESEIERFIRDAKVTAIYAGSSNSQMENISEPWINKNKEM